MIDRNTPTQNTTATTKNSREEQVRRAFLAFQSEQPTADYVTFKAGYFSGGIENMLSMLSAVHPKGAEHGLPEINPWNDLDLD